MGNATKSESSSELSIIRHIRAILLAVLSDVFFARVTHIFCFLFGSRIDEISEYVLDILSDLLVCSLLVERLPFSPLALHGTDRV